MSLVEDFNSSETFAGAQHTAARPRLTAGLLAVPLVACGTLAILLVYAAGHPFMAFWLALNLLGVLFMAGAAKASA